jgi:glycosyltransferase involved in cell wall biosynthesis
VRFGIDSHSAEREGEGNTTYTRHLIAALLAAGGDDDVALFAGNPAHPFYRSLPSRHGSPVVRVPQARGIARLGWALARAASRARIDVLHVQYVAPLWYRGPLVVTVHDLGYLHVPESFPLGLRVALRTLVPPSIKRAALIVAVSEFTRRDIVARYRIPPEKVVVTPEGADARFRPRSTEETVSVLARYGLQPGFVFSLGRLNRRKNLERLLQAYARLRRDGLVDVPLVIGGKPDYGLEETLRRARSSGASSGVRFAGLISDEDLPVFYSGAACFVYPSLFEGFGLPALEAMACGTPVIASDRTAIPEVVGDAALSVNPESVDALAEAMRRVLTDRDLAMDLSRRGLARSRQFTWAEAARLTREAYREAARGHRGRQR